MVDDSNLGRHRAYMPSAEGLWVIDEGVPCPSDDAVLWCSGHGSCNCNTGVCTCPSQCWQGELGAADISHCFSQPP
jgi:hypothetical protein